MDEEKQRNTLTRAWRMYELGRSYNNALVPNQYNLVNTNLEFYAGNQWQGLPQTPAMARLPKPVFNIIKRITNLFVAALTANATTISFESLAYYDGSNENDERHDAATFATAEVRNLFDKFKLEYRIRDALFDGAVTGDYAAHFYWDPTAIPYGGAYGPYQGEIQMEMVDGINVMFGNPNERTVEKQPYILIVGRDTVGHLRAERKKYAKMAAKKSKKATSVYDDSDLIQPDADNTYQAGIGGRHERTMAGDDTDKCLYVYLYTKVTKTEEILDPNTGEPMLEPVLDKNGDPVPDTDENGDIVLDLTGQIKYKMKVAKRPVTSVHVTKATRSCNIFEDIDTGLSRYPIAWGNWEHQKNQYHGRALVTGIIPNQLFINQMFAMVMRHLQLMGFPKTVYNADLIGQWNNEVGTAIGVRNLVPGQRIGDVAAQLQPADMSYQIIQAIDKAMEYTKECLGATDIQLGAVKPDNTSAMMVLQANSEVPLEIPRANKDEWIEDIGAILLDMMGTYYGKRPIIIERSMEELIPNAAGQAQLNGMTGMMMTQKVTRKVKEEFDFSQFKHLYLNCRTDVGATSQYSEISIVQTLDNLRRDGTLDIIEYLERIPDRLIPRKQELVEKLKAQIAEQQSMANTAGLSPELAEAAKLNGTQPMQQAAIAGAPKLATQGVMTPQDAGDMIGRMPQGIQDKYAQYPGFARKSLESSIENGD